MENYLLQLKSLQTSGQVFMPVPGDRRLAMIATQDIAGSFKASIPSFFL